MGDTTTCLKVLEKKARDLASDSDELLVLAGQAPSVDRLLAKHPNASVLLLESLSRSGDRATRRAVAIHPNTPKDALVRLATQFPSEFFRNPAFEWLLLEDPTLLSRVGDSVLLSLLKRADCPVALLQWAVGRADGYVLPRTSPRSKYRLAVAMNPATPAKLLRRLVNMGGAVGEAATWHVSIAKPDAVNLDEAFESCIRDSLKDELRCAAIDEWRRGRIGPSQWLGLSLEARLACPLDLRLRNVVSGALPAHADALTCHPHPEVRRELARLATSPDQLEALSFDKVDAVREEVAGNRASFASTLERLSQDRVADVRHRLAGNPSTPSVVLTTLASVRSEETRQWLAANASTPAQVLATLALARSVDIREAVAGNESTGPSVLTNLAMDRRLEVRQSVARNPSTPSATLIEMAKAEKRQYDLAVWLALNPKAPTELRAASCRTLAESDRSDRRVAVECLVCPSDVLERLSKDAEPSVRMAVARNATVSSDVLKNLSKDRSKDVRSLAMARLCGESGNETTQSSERLELAVSWQAVLRKAAKRLVWNESDSALSELLPDALLDMHQEECMNLLCDPAKSVLARMMGAVPENLLRLPDDKVRQAARSTERAVRLLGLCHANADRIDLVKGYRSTDWAQRMAIARNPATPSGVIDLLIKDAHRLVALQAQVTRSRKEVVRIAN